MQRLYAFLAELALKGHLPAPFQYAFVVRGVLAILLLAPLLGGMSHLVVVRRLAFFSTALGQASLTGLTIGLLLGEPISAPYVGVFGFSLIAALLMVYVKRRSSLPPDTLIGVFMALTLGLGICLLVAATRQFNIHQIEGVMFGSLLTVTDTDLLLLVLVSLAVLGLLAYHYNGLLLDSLGRPLAQVSGVKTAFVEYLFVLLLTLAIVVSLKVIGALLVEALVVVPAAGLTHAASGIGEATAKRFVEEGARVVVADLQVDKGEAVTALSEVPYILAEIGEPGGVKLCLRLLKHTSADVVAAAQRDLADRRGHVLVGDAAQALGELQRRALHSGRGGLAGERGEAVVHAALVERGSSRSTAITGWHHARPATRAT